MRKSKFSESQIVSILKDAEGGIAVADLLRKHGISKATFFKWRSKYGGTSVSDVKRLRELEAENAKLKRMYADLALTPRSRTFSTESCNAVCEATDHRGPGDR
jgi:putative transposase